MVLLSLFSYATQDHLHMGGSTHSGLGSLIAIINQEKAPTVQVVAAHAFNLNTQEAETGSSL